MVALGHENILNLVSLTFYMVISRPGVQVNSKLFSTWLFMAWCVLKQNLVFLMFELFSQSQLLTNPRLYLPNTCSTRCLSLVVQWFKSQSKSQEWCVSPLEVTPSIYTPELPSSTFQGAKTLSTGGLLLFQPSNCGVLHSSCNYVLFTFLS